MTASFASSGLLPAPAFSRLNPAKNWGWNADQQRLETLVNGLKTVMNMSPVLQQLLCHQSGCDACRRTGDNLKTVIERELDNFESRFRGLCQLCIEGGQCCARLKPTELCTLHSTNFARQLEESLREGEEESS
jgi:hypothetical protein